MLGALPVGPEPSDTVEFISKYVFAPKPIPHDFEEFRLGVSEALALVGCTIQPDNKHRELHREIIEIETKILCH